VDTPRCGKAIWFVKPETITPQMYRIVVYCVIVLYERGEQQATRKKKRKKRVQVTELSSRTSTSSREDIEMDQRIPVMQADIM